jgi:hypothetical protein
MYKTRYRRFLAALATVSAVVAALLTATGTAAAADSCRTNSQFFSTPGFGTTVDVQLCVHARYGTVWADATVYWEGPYLPIADRFEVFEFNVRLEFRDDVRISRSCYPATAINNREDGSYICPETAHLTYSGGPYWTADATVRYNDGDGDQLWPLAGTPAV